MKKNIVYILGAGFSQPAGIPTTIDFLSKSKDIYETKNKDYIYFNSIFKLIDEYAKITRVMNSNQEYLEEVFSLLDMNEYINNNNSNSKMYKSYICDVINYSLLNYEFYSTNRIYTYNDGPSNSISFVDDENKNRNIINLYTNFLASIFKLEIKTFNDLSISSISSINNEYNYSIISLNYDTILEGVYKIIFSEKDYDKFKFIYNYNEYEKLKNTNISIVPFAKLHGSVNEPESIIPPTTIKYANNTIKSTWKLAYELLKNANYYRIIGYSLPVTDSYIQYLLKTALKDNINFKKADIICLDDNKHTIKNRYSKLFVEDKFRFYNKNISIILNNPYCDYYYVKGEEKHSFLFNRIETHYTDFMEKER